MLKEIAIAAIALAAIAYGGEKKYERKIPTTLIAPPDALPHYVLGYNEVVTDSLWIRLLQDIDLCKPGQGALVATNPQEWEEHGKILAESKGPRCEKGWSFRMIDAMTELSPMFKAPYVNGAPILSVLTDDREGALIIYEKGAKRFPDDFRLSMGAAYHNLFEMKDEKRAAEHLIQAGKSGAPDWVYALAGRLFTENGQAMLASIHLRETIQRIEAAQPDHPMLPRLKERLANAERQLKSTGP